MIERERERVIGLVAEVVFLMLSYLFLVFTELSAEWSETIIYFTYFLFSKNLKVGLHFRTFTGIMTV